MFYYKNNQLDNNNNNKWFQHQSNFRWDGKYERMKMLSYVDSVKKMHSIRKKYIKNEWV